MAVRRIKLRHYSKVFVASLLIALVVFLLPRVSPKFFAFEHKYSDWRTVLLSSRKGTQDDRILIVKITEDDIKEFKYRSPIDRQYLAGIISYIDSFNPSVIGLDLLVDQPTEGEKDNAFFEALTLAKERLVLANVDRRYPSTSMQRDYMWTFLNSIGSESGFINLASDIDGVIRRMPHPPDGFKRLSFADVIAKKSGVKLDQDVRYWEKIAWLGQPKDGTDVFLETPVKFFIDNPDIAERWTKGKIVLIGADLSDNDKHRTPYSVLGKELSLTPGVEIHAQMIAQRLDSRRVRLISKFLEFILYLTSAFTAFWLFSKYSHVPRFARTTSYFAILLLVFDALVFKYFALIIPTAMVVLCYSLVLALLYLFDKLRRNENKNVSIIAR